MSVTVIKLMTGSKFYDGDDKIDAAADKIWENEDQRSYQDSNVLKLCADGIEEEARH